jgi:hypothetical protein
LGDVDVDGKIILKRILEEEDVKIWTGLIWFRIGSSVSCKDSIEC